MKKNIPLFILLIISFQLLAQELKPNPFGEKYNDPNFEAMKVIKVIEPSGFKPRKMTTDMNEFKSIILQLSSRAYTQLNIDSWYLCSFKHEEYFEIYNVYYKYVPKYYYDENCKALITLMLLDGTIKLPR